MLKVRCVEPKGRDKQVTLKQHGAFHSHDLITLTAEVENEQNQNVPHLNC